jgi:hypothetical protein
MKRLDLHRQVRLHVIVTQRSGQFVDAHSPR